MSFWSAKRVLVTGGVSFLGSFIVEKLRHHRLAFFAYPLSGGFEHPSLMPTWMIRPVLALERFLGVLSRSLAFRILVVLETDTAR